MQRKMYDAIIIGAGAGGITVAVGLGRRGKKVALVEAHKVGGECTHTGCVPSKSFIRGAHAADPQAFEVVREVIKKVEKEEATLLASLPTVELITGHAQFRDAHTVDVISGEKTLTLTASAIIIATGARARVLDIPGLPKEKYLSTDTFFSLKKLPEKLVIIGSGAVACELACAAAQLGSTVTLVNRGTALLKDLGLRVSETLEKVFTQQGIVCHWQVQDMQATSSHLTFKAGTTQVECAYDAVLVVIGREPALASLSLDKAGVIYSDRGIEVDEGGLTSVPSIYAIGDVTTRGGTTYIANEQGRRVVQQLLVPFLPVYQRKGTLTAVYTSPEIAQTGMTLADLRALPADACKAYSFELAATDRGITDGLTHGYLEVIAERVTGRLLQATLIAPHASEMISFFSLCFEQRITLWKIRNLVFPYPTLLQGVRSLADQFMVTTVSHFPREASALLRSKVQYLWKSHGMKLVVVAAWLVCSVLLHIWFRASGQNINTLLTLFAQVSRTSMWGPLLYSGVYFLRPLTLLPASILTAAAGSLWGVQSGYVYALIAATLSSLLPYALGRWWSKDTRGAQQFQRFFNSNGFESVLMLRFLFFPYDAVSVAAGVMKVPLGSFLVATILGNTVGTLTFVSLGATLPLDDIAHGMVKFKLSSLLPSLGLALATVCLSQLVKRLILRYKRNRHV